MLILIFAGLLAQADDNAIQAESWARKAKPIAECATALECDEKWKRAVEWIRNHSRFQIAVDRPNLFATYGAVYANVDLSFVIERRSMKDGRFQIAGRAWCGNVITCKPKPKDAVAALARVLEGG